MVRFMREHVAQHLRANLPGLCPAISQKIFNTSAAIQRLGKHLRAASGALRQSRACLRRSAVRAVQLRRRLQMRSRQPDPLTANIVHVGEDGRDSACVARRIGSPRGRIKLLQQNLVHLFVDRENAYSGLAELGVRPGLTIGHGSALPAPWYFRSASSCHKTGRVPPLALPTCRTV